jgi:uroporphyrinogen decarboxylase
METNIRVAGKEMIYSKRELVKRAIAHQESERVPYFITFTQENEPVICKYFQTEDIHCAIGNYVYPVSCPWWDWASVPEAYQKLDSPTFIPHTKGVGSYPSFEDKLKWVRDHTDSYILVMIYGSHFEKANFLRGIEGFLSDLAGNKKYAKNLLDFIIHKNMVMIENILSYDQIDGILLGSDWGSQLNLLMSPACWRELIKPGEQMEYNLIKSAGKDIWIHSCGNIERIIPDLVEMGIDVLNPVQPEAMNIAELKRNFGSKITFWGGISTQQTLPYGTPKQVKEETLSIRTKMSKGGGYIIAPAQDIQTDVPIENVMALLEAAKI